jgi:hypothetical protein
MQITYMEKYEELLELEEAGESSLALDGYPLEVEGGSDSCRRRCRR